MASSGDLSATDTGSVVGTLTVHHARAYCGPAHGHAWPVDVQGPLLSVVWLGDPTDPTPYRLIMSRRPGRPARDHLGNYVYLPMPRSGQES